MQVKGKTCLIYSLATLSLFVAYTLAVTFIDVQTVSATGSEVGFATLNFFLHKLIGVNLFWYTLTDYAGILPILLVVFFAFMGIVQWIKGKSIKAVDKNIFSLGILYVATALVYVIFELVVVNCRPILIEGVLETSYPSSTTILATVVLVSAIDQVSIYVKNCKLKKLLTVCLVIFALFLIVGRVISGVHWFTDIIGSIIISFSLLLFYLFVKIRLFEGISRK